MSLKKLEGSKATHGTASTYIQYGCRCDECKAANRKHITRLRLKRLAQPKDPNDPRHGTYTFYVNHGCRCDACKVANAEASAAAYARRKVKAAEK